MIVTLAGHVDHGKTSLVHALTGVDTDTLAEEKRRGLTIDLGFAYADLGDEKTSRVGFVDVPGHHRFVHNMVAGIASRQFAMLVIAVDDGVMPQSREHLQILSLLGLSRGIVVLNKIDRVPPARVAEVRRDVGALTAGTFLHDAPTLPVSCITGTGVAEVRRHIASAARADRAYRGERTVPTPNRPSLHGARQRHRCHRYRAGRSRANRRPSRACRHRHGGSHSRRAGAEPRCRRRNPGRPRRHQPCWRQRRRGNPGRLAAASRKPRTGYTHLH